MSDEYHKWMDTETQRKFQTTRGAIDYCIRRSKSDEPYNIVPVFEGVGSDE